MNKFTNFIDARIGPIANKIANQRHLVAIRDGLILTMPLMILGSLFIIIGELPFEGYQNLMINIFGESFWTSFVWNDIVPATMGLSALIAVCGISYNLVKSQNLDGLGAVGLALPAYFLLCVAGEGGYGSELFGAEGLFLAIITALIVGEIYIFIFKKDLVIKLPSSVPPAVGRAFASLVPGMVVVILFFALRLIFAATSYESAQNFILEILQKPLTAINASFAGALIAALANSFLWCFGLHGDLIVNSVTGPLLQTGYLENVAALQAGTTIPYVNVDGFSAVFLNIGGTGTAMALAILCLIFAKSKSLKTLGKLSMTPSLFNISEPIIFGLPIVLNPLLIIPFLIVPVVTTSITYFAMATNLVDKIVALPPWTTPIFLSGYLATGGDWKAVVLQGITLVVAIVIYMPFVKLLDKKYVNDEKNENTLEKANFVK